MRTYQRSQFGAEPALVEFIRHSNKLASGSGRAAALANNKELKPEQKIEQLYMIAFARKPLSEETAAAMAHLEKFKFEKTAYEDLLWALINTKEVFVQSLKLSSVGPCNMSSQQLQRMNEQGRRMKRREYL